MEMILINIIIINIIKNRYNKYIIYKIKNNFYNINIYNNKYNINININYNDRKN